MPKYIVEAIIDIEIEAITHQEAHDMARKMLWQPFVQAEDVSIITTTDIDTEESEEWED